MTKSRKKKDKKSDQTTLDKHYPVGYTPDEKQRKGVRKNKNDGSSNSSSKQETIQPSLKGSTRQMHDMSINESSRASVSCEPQRNLIDEAANASVNFDGSVNMDVDKYVKKNEEVPYKPDQRRNDKAQAYQENKRYPRDQNIGSLSPEIPRKPWGQTRTSESNIDLNRSNESWEFLRENAENKQNLGDQNKYNKSAFSPKNYDAGFSNSSREKSRGRGRHFDNRKDREDDNFTGTKRYSGNHDRHNKSSSSFRGGNQRYSNTKSEDHRRDSGSHRMQNESTVESERYTEKQKRRSRSSSSPKKGKSSRDSSNHSRERGRDSESNRSHDTSYQWNAWDDKTIASEGNSLRGWNTTGTSDFEGRKLTRNECDEEYGKFLELLEKGKIERFEKVQEEQNDLFAMPDVYCLAHCVAEDMNMGSGIAVTFRQMFKRVDILLNQGQKTGGLAVLQDKDRFIYYLVTKQNSSGKPTLRTLFASLLKMRQHIEQNKVKKLAMPRIGCGLDRLEWSEVKPMLEYIFQDVDVKIVVCNFQQNYGKTKQKLQQKSEPKNKDLKQSGKKQNKNKKHKK